MKGKSRKHDKVRFFKAGDTKAETDFLAACAIMAILDFPALLIIISELAKAKYPHKFSSTSV